MKFTELDENFQTIPNGPLGIIALPGCEELAKKIDWYLTSWRSKRHAEHKETLHFRGYDRSSYLVDIRFPRFGTGEGKATIRQTVRGYDLFILCDCFNYGVTYEMYGMEVPMSPDEHFANLKRAISAIGGKAKSITVIMPMLYEGRQHKRSSRESLDCANMLQELCNEMGVDNIITFDAHDPRVQNAIPLKGFENVQPVYQMIKAMTRTIDNLHFDKDHLMVISPDEGGMGRCIYYSTVLEVELGMFYKRRDYTRIVNGRNPIIAHEFLGANVEGKDVIIVDDMISSGESMIEVATKLKALKANRIFVCTSFGLFCNGLDAFDEAYEKGLIHKVFTTNLIYRTPELLARPWYAEVDLSKYVSLLIDTLNHDLSVSSLLDPADRIENLLVEKGFKQTKE
ncbi:MAG: ribose-phosphate pyrophosphokinase [Clostridia bacterium]|nr:ribose-phosphate pyrophosphokinase [Clostridia bacterium]MBR6619728.1 ribose-phosphate pyrophosphokinase [Clostridia bacterium]